MQTTAVSQVEVLDIFLKKLQSVSLTQLFYLLYCKTKKIAYNIIILYGQKRNMTVFFCQMVPDFRKSSAFWKIFRFRLFVLLHTNSKV